MNTQLHVLRRGVQATTSLAASEDGRCFVLVQLCAVGMDQLFVSEDIGVLLYGQVEEERKVKRSLFFEVVELQRPVVRNLGGNPVFARVDPSRTLVHPSPSFSPPIGLKVPIWIPTRKTLRRSQEAKYSTGMAKLFLFGCQKRTRAGTHNAMRVPPHVTLPCHPQHTHTRACA